MRVLLNLGTLIRVKNMVFPSQVQIGPISSARGVLIKLGSLWIPGGKSGDWVKPIVVIWATKKIIQVNLAIFIVLYGKSTKEFDYLLFPPFASSRSSLRNIFPTLDFGSSVRNSMNLGRLYPVRYSLAYSFNSFSVNDLSFLTTKILTTSEECSSSTPTAATSRTFGCMAMTFSTSLG